MYVVKHFFFQTNLNLQSREQEKTIDKMTVIHDLSNVGRHNIRKVVLQVVENIAKVDQSHYPETLHVAYIVNVPFIFYGVWKIVKIFLHENTKKKIKIVSRKETEKVLSETIESCQLPVFLGGSCTCMEDKTHGGCVSSKDFSNTLFFAELDAYVNAHTISTLE